MSPASTAAMNSLTNVSQLRNTIRASGSRSSTRWQMAWSRCVLPSPTPPWMNSGLYALPGWSATAELAACASRLQGPVTNWSNA